MEANAGEYIKNYLHLKSFPRISLHCKLVPVLYWEYEYGLFAANFSSFFFFCFLRAFIVTSFSPHCCYTDQSFSLSRIICLVSWPAYQPLSQSVDWIAKGAAQRSRTEGAVLPARRSAPEHDLYITSEHSTTARWIRLGVDFEEGGNRSARRKPSKSGWDRLKLNPHTTFVVEVEGVIDVHYAILTSQGVQHRVFYRDGHPSRYQPRPTGLNFGEQTGTGVSL